MSSEYGFRTTTDENEIFRRLATYHGIDSNTASLRLHQLKGKHGLRGDDNVIFDLTGNVYRVDVIHEELERLGTLTAHD